MPHLINIDGTQHFSDPCEVVFCVVPLLVCFVLLSLNFLIKPSEHLLVTSCQGNYQMYFAFVRSVLYLMTGISEAFKCLYFDLSNSRTLGI